MTSRELAIIEGAMSEFLLTLIETFPGGDYPVFSKVSIIVHEQTEVAPGVQAMRISGEWKSGDPDDNALDIFVERVKEDSDA